MGDALVGTIMGVFSDVYAVLSTIRISDLLDIALVALVVYYGIKFLRQTMFSQLLVGVLLLVVVYMLSFALSLTAINFMLEYIFNFGIILIIIVFQPEIRKALATFGTTNISFFSHLLSGSNSEEEVEERKSVVNNIVAAAMSLASSKTGALIVIEKGISLGDICATGTAIDSKVMSALLESMFFPNSPLHDGAVIIRDTQIAAAGCFLPLSETSSISKTLGTRHRAAVGVSEMSDAVVVTVSEETGTISFARAGELTRFLDEDKLRKVLTIEIVNPVIEKSGADKGFFRKGKGDAKKR